MAKRSLPFLAWLASTGLSSAALAQPAQPVGHEFLVNTHTTGGQRHPSISSDGSGHFIAVWESGQDGSGLGIIGQRYDTNTNRRVGGEFLVNTYTTSDQRIPSVSSDPKGNFVVVWHSPQDEGSSGVFGQRYDRRGNPLGGEFQVNTYRPSTQTSPEVSSDASGNFVVVWQSLYQDGGGGGYDRDWGVFGQRYDSEGNPLGGEFQVNTYTTDTQWQPSVASDASGNFVVVWAAGRPYLNEPRGIFGQRYDSDGNRLGGEFEVSALRSESPSVASNADGDFVVVWNDQAFYDAHVFGRRYDSGGNPLGDAFQVSPQAEYEYSQDSARAVLDASGDFIVVWEITQQNSHVYETNVRARRFASDGRPLGRHVQVNERTIENGTGAPAIAAADEEGGNFVVVWGGNLYNGDGYDVRGRRMRKGASIGPAEVTAVVVKASNNGIAKAWRQLNDEWRLYGDTSIYIDMTSLGDTGAFTLEDLVETRADVVLVNNPGGWLPEYQPSEIDAITSYAAMGHNVIGTYDLFQGSGDDNRAFAPMFGLRSDLSYEDSIDISNIFNVLDPDNHLFRGIPNSWISQGRPFTQSPTDDLRWDEPDLAGATIVAEVDNFKGMISVYDGGSYTGIYFSNLLEDSGGFLDKQLLYNAITYPVTKAQTFVGPNSEGLEVVP